MLLLCIVVCYGTDHDTTDDEDSVDVFQIHDNMSDGV